MVKVVLKRAHSSNHQFNFNLDLGSFVLSQNETEKMDQWFTLQLDIPIRVQSKGVTHWPSFVRPHSDLKDGGEIYNNSKKGEGI